jgi:integrase/recombinase XerD
MACKKCRKEINSDWLHCPWCGSKQKQTKRKTIKRENGTGSVYKRSDLKYRPWVAATPAKRNKKAEIIGYYETAQEAKDALAEFIKNPTTKLNITLKELYEEWLPIGLKGKSFKTEETYKTAYLKLESIKNDRFRDLRTGHLQRIIDDMDNEGLSYSAMHHVKVLMGLLYKYAMQNDIVHKNYAQFLKLPKKPKGVKPAFTDLQLKIIEKNIGMVEFADCVYFLCYTGLRITEFVTLNKFQVHEIGNNYALYGGIKTDAGENKIIPVHPKIKSILKTWMDKGGETIFCRPDGTPYTAHYFRNYCFYPALEKMGIQENKHPRKLTPHAARRTFATMLSKAGVREEDFITMMGHSDYSVGIESYIYQTAEKLQPVIEQLP